MSLNLSEPGVVESETGGIWMGLDGIGFGLEEKKKVFVEQKWYDVMHRGGQSSLV